MALRIKNATQWAANVEHTELFKGREGGAGLVFMRMHVRSIHMTVLFTGIGEIEVS